MGAITFSIRLAFEPIRTIGFGSIGAGYMGIGTALVNPARQIFIQNDTDATLMFSLDGINDHFALPANGFLLLDITSNKTAEEGLFIQAGTRFYVKEIGTPSTGSVYLSVMYGINV